MVNVHYSQMKWFVSWNMRHYHTSTCLRSIRISFTLCPSSAPAINEFINDLENQIKMILVLSVVSLKVMLSSQSPGDREFCYSPSRSLVSPVRSCATH